MPDQIEIASASVISFSLLILAIGVVWSPFAALICAKAVSVTGRSAGGLARAGALHSILFLFPWVYFLLRILNRRIPDRVVMGAYALLYLACLLGPIMFNVLLAWEIYGLHSNYPDGDGYANPINHSPSFWTGAMFAWTQAFSNGAYFTFESTVFWVASLIAVATVFFYLWVKSLSRLFRMYFEARNRVDQTDSNASRLPNVQYMEPLKTTSGIFGLWLISLVTFINVGTAVFNDCAWNCTT